MHASERTVMEKISLVIYLILMCSMMVMLIYSLWIHNRIFVFGSFFGTLLSLIILIIARVLNVILPWPLELGIIMMIFLHVVGGSVGLYKIFPPYDSIVHFTSSALIGFSVLTMAYLLNKHANAAFKITLPLMVLLSITCAATMGMLWEIGEFAFDQLFGWGQQYGLYDTMIDLTIDTAGGMAGGIVGGLLIKLEKFSSVIQSLDKSAERLAVRWGVEGT